MMTADQNVALTQVGQGRPAGELLRRYWHPVVPVQELSAEQPVRHVRLLGEDLVLYRDASQRVGCLADRCAHRGASLLYGRVESRGIACAYHGWLYDTSGAILETPPERNEAIMKRVRQRAYPVRRLAGLYWVYLGPLPAPEIPPFDVLVRRDGRRRIEIHPVLDCNWLQAMENSVDPAHAQILHQGLGRSQNRRVRDRTRGAIDEVRANDFPLWEFGIMKRRAFHDGLVEQHPLIFPNALRVNNVIQYRVPIDDTRTMHLHVEFYPTRDRSDVEEGDALPVRVVPPYKTPADGAHPRARYHMDSVIAQDHMAWETQGAVADRTVENLASSDRAIVLFRRLLWENIASVEQGGDPVGVLRDPGRGTIDTGLDATLEEMQLTGRFQGYAEDLDGDRG